MFPLICLDRKQGSLTSDPGPLCGCERVCVFILLACALEQVLSDAGWMHRWSSLSWQSVQVRMTGVSCPKVHESWGGDVCYPQCQRAAEYRHSQEVRRMIEERGKKRGGEMNKESGKL